MRIRKIIVCFICLLFVNSCNSTLLCVPSAKKVKVEDVFLEQNYVPSYRINTNDRYCLFYQKWNNIKPSITSKFEDQIPEILKEFGIKFKEEKFVPTVQEKKTDIFLQEISKREIKNNYENCDYIMYYDTFGINIGEKDICSSILGINIIVFDIRNDKYITKYSFNKGTYQLSQQEEFTKELMNKWWEFQNKPNKKKFEAMECNYIGCKTIKCKGDNCSISEIKEYK